MDTDRRKGISASTLKWIAVVTMFIDHLTAVVFLTWLSPLRQSMGIYPILTQGEIRLYYFLRGVGRLSFPIFCFLLVEGYLHTRSVKKYLGRLFIFGLVSEIPFDLAFDRMLFQWDSQNVYFTLFLGLLAVWLTDLALRGWRNYSPGRKALGILWAAAVLAACMILADWAQTDYAWSGVLMIVLMFLLRRQEIPRFLASALALLPVGQRLGEFARSLLEGHPTTVFSGRIEMAGLPVFVLFHFYNGQRGRQPKYFFYIFYPLHLSLLVLARYLAVGW